MADISEEQTQTDSVDHFNHAAAQLMSILFGAWLAEETLDELSAGEEEGETEDAAKDLIQEEQYKRDRLRNPGLLPRIGDRFPTHSDEPEKASEPFADQEDEKHDVKSFSADEGFEYGIFMMKECKRILNEP